MYMEFEFIYNFNLCNVSLNFVDFIFEKWRELKIKWQNKFGTLSKGTRPWHRISKCL